MADNTSKVGKSWFRRRRRCSSVAVTYGEFHQLKMMMFTY